MAYLHDVKTETYNSATTGETVQTKIKVLNIKAPNNSAYNGFAPVAENTLLLKQQGSTIVFDDPAMASAIIKGAPINMGLLVELVNDYRRCGNLQKYIDAYTEKE